MTSNHKNIRLDSGHTKFSAEPKSLFEENIYDQAAIFLFGVVALIFILTFRDYGYSWDEVTQNRWYGQAVLRFIQSFGEETSALHTNNFYLYGGLFDAIAELIPLITPLDGFGARRFANTSIGFLALVGTWKTARKLAGPRAGFWALILLVTTPVWYGHTFINAKDIPFAAGYIWSLYFIIKVAEKLPEIPWGTAIGLGLAFGLSIGIRVGGVLVIIYFFMMITIYLSSRQVNAKNPPGLKALQTGIFNKALLSLAIAWIMMVAFWPTVLLYPVTGLIDAFLASSHFKWGGDVLFNGVLVSARDLPWHYLPVYFAVKLPIPILLMFFAGVLWALVHTVQHAKQHERPKLAGPDLLVFAIIFPPVYAISTGAIIYDGVRHFLFILPPAACLAGVAMTELIPLLDKHLKQASKLLYSALGVYLVFHTWTMIQIHPYQYTYLNSLGGGIPAAANNYETDYWITSYREATFKMLDYAKNYARQEGVPFENRRFDVAVFGDINIIQPLVPENFIVESIDTAEKSDFYISSTRMEYDKKFPTWRVFDKVERMGMTFAVLKTSLPSITQTNQ